jgi:formylglycine-generating enzyme
VTRAQWYRLSNGVEPSTNTRGIAFPGDPLIGWTHPVDSVDWTMGVDLLAHHGLILPTEARWEYGARADASTKWWTGDDPESLAGAANVLDLRATRAYPNWGNQIGDFDDGFVGSSAVGSLRANPFGLHDTVGNLWEWCYDYHQQVYGPARDGDGLRAEDGSTDGYRTYRGCAYTTNAEAGRSAARAKMASISRGATIGVRAARDVIEAGE